MGGRVTRQSLFPVDRDTVRAYLGSNGAFITLNRCQTILILFTYPYLRWLCICTSTHAEHKLFIASPKRILWIVGVAIEKDRNRKCVRHHRCGHHYFTCAFNWMEFATLRGHGQRMQERKKSIFFPLSLLVCFQLFFSLCTTYQSWVVVVVTHRHKENAQKNQ